MKRMARRVAVVVIFWALICIFFAKLIPAAIDRELAATDAKVSAHLNMCRQ